MNGVIELIKSELNDAIFNKNKEAINRLSIIIGEKLEDVDEIKDENEGIKGDIRELIGIVKKGFEEQNQRIIELREDMNQRVKELREDMNKRFSMMFAFMTAGYTIITLLILIFKFLK